MTTQATWGNRTWEVSPDRLAGLASVSISKALKQNQSKDKEGKGSVNKRGFEAQSISLSWPVAQFAGVDIQTERSEWEKLVGASDCLMIGGEQFGPDLLMLQSFSMNEARLDSRGRIISAVFTAAFSEDTQEKSSAKSAKRISKANPEIYRDLGITSGAQVGPSDDEKQRKREFA